MTKGDESPQRGTLKQKSVSWLTTRLEAIYSEKIISDARADAVRTPRQDFAEFLYDFYLYRFGIRTVAQHKLHELFFNVRRHYFSHDRVRVFACFMGMEEDMLMAEQD